MSIIPFTGDTVALISQLEGNVDSLNSMQVTPDVFHHAEIIERLINALVFNTTLTKVHLDDVSLSPAARLAFAQLLRFNNTITHLALADNDLDPTFWVAFGTALQVNQAITTLWIARNDVGIIGGRALGAALECNKTLCDLYLDCVLLDNSAVTSIANALQINKTLTHLGIIDNGLTEVRSIADMLNFNSTLLTLDLSQNNLGCNTAAFLAVALNRNHTLESLILDQNNINGSGGLELAAMLINNHGLLSLSLRKNALGDTACIHMAITLSINISLKYLDLSVNLFGLPTITAFAEMLIVNTTLETLLLRSDDNYDVDYDEAPIMADAQALKLVTAVQHNRTITKLDVWGFTWSDAGMRAIADAMCVNFTLCQFITCEDETETSIMDDILARNKVLSVAPYWTMKKHVQFPTRCHSAVICILLAAGRFQPTLPEELWLDIIMSHFRVSDFYNSALSIPLSPFLDLENLLLCWAVPS